jgi:hypothetical protein
MVTYDSGANRHYISEKDWHKANLPILQTSTWKVGVANGGTSKAKYVTQLSFQQLSAQAMQAATLQNFPMALMSVGKMANDGTVSVFTKKVSMYSRKKTCSSHARANPSSSELEIAMVDAKYHWCNNGDNDNRDVHPKKAWKTLRQANSIYDLPSTKQATKWMHTICGYPVKSTWPKAIKAGNYVGWQMLNEHNIQKYYPKTIKTANGHLNQTRKNVRTTKAKTAPLETCDTSQLHAK